MMITIDHYSEVEVFVVAILKPALMRRQCSSWNSWKQWQCCFMYALLLMQVSRAKAAISKEQKLKEQLREQMAAAANDSKRQVYSMAHVGQRGSL